MKWLVCLYLIYLQSTFILGEISWESCDKDSNDIELLNVVVKPYPIIAPGSVTVEITIRIKEDIVKPVKAELSLYKKVLFGSVSVPCVGNIGSCTYDDICGSCAECTCPLKAGDHVLTLPINIEVASWVIVGNYQGEVRVQTGSGQKTCVKVNNVHIQSS